MWVNSAGVIQEPAQGVSHWLAAVFAAKPGRNTQPWGCQRMLCPRKSSFFTEGMLEDFFFFFFAEG